METLLIYFLKVNISLTMFYFLYVLSLKKDTFIRLKRYFFLAAIVFSFVYPFFTIEAWANIFSFTRNRYAAEVIMGQPSFSLLSGESLTENNFIDWKNILFSAMVAGTAFFIVRFTWQLITIVHIKRKSVPKRIDGQNVYHLSEEMMPFSFFKWIFIDTEAHSEEELRQILMHEQIHVRQWHSLDSMLTELLCIFFWWNPFVWLMKKEITINLEYLADSETLRKGVNSRDYQYHLLRLTYHETAVQIVNNFNVSQLKKRIMMMNKSKSPTLSLVKYLLMLPLIFLLAAANSVYATQNESGSEQTAESARNVRSEEELLSPALYGSETENMQEPPPVKKKGNEETFVVVENQPEFPGGNEALMKFLADNVQYPKEAQEKGIQGRVICNFVVMKDGSITDVNVVRGVDSLLDAEAVRVLELMPKWTPGTQRGQAVNVRFTLPVVFSLQEGVEKRPTSSETIEQLR